MATVTRVTDTRVGNVQVDPLRLPALPMGVDPAAFGGGRLSPAYQLARAAEQVGDSADRVIDLQERLKKQQLSVDLDRASVDDQLALHDLVRTAEAEAGPGAAGHVDRVRGIIGDLKKKRLEAYKDRPEAQTGIEKYFAGFELRYVDEASNFQTKAIDAHTRTQRKAAAEGRANLILLNPDSYGDQLQQQLKAIEQSPGSAEAKAEAAQEVTHMFAEAHWRGRLAKDPAGVAGALRSEANTGLDFETRLQIIGQADAAVERQQSEAREEIRFKWAQDAEAERQADRAREANAGALTAGVLAGQVGLKQIESAVRGRQLSPAEGRVLANMIEERGKAAAEGPKDDFREVARLLQLKSESPDAVRSEALRARESGLISTTTMTSLMKSDVQEERATVKAARDQLKRSLKPEGLTAMLSEDQAERVVNAERMFNEALAVDPKADPYRIAEEVTRTFKGAEVSPEALPMPRYLRGSIEAPDVEASIAALQQARDNDEIDDLTMSIEAKAITRVAKEAAKRAKGGAKP